MACRHRAPFSLIELLTVIGIIALLAGLLLPVLSGARDSSRRAECGSNLRQTGVGLRQFALDNGGFLPYATTPADWSNSSFTLLNSYLDNPKGFLCPGDRRTGVKPATDFTAFTTTANVCSYSLARRLSWLPQFKDFILALDRVGTGQGNPAGSTTPGPQTFSLLAGGSGVKGARWVDGNHGTKGGNILFGDGRVSFEGALPVDMVNATNNQTATPVTPRQITAQNPK
jgi:prepilin-type processing-associated H-X9-DG protein